jgi:hypothetical protein
MAQSTSQNWAQPQRDALLRFHEFIRAAAAMARPSITQSSRTESGRTDAAFLIASVEGTSRKASDPARVTAAYR